MLISWRILFYVYIIVVLKPLFSQRHVEAPDTHVWYSLFKVYSIMSATHLVGISEHA